jgi:hypothetical protein
MRVTTIWTAPLTLDLESPDGGRGARASAVDRLANAMAACNNAHLAARGHDASGDPTQLAMLAAAAELFEEHRGGPQPLFPSSRRRAGG